MKKESTRDTKKEYARQKEINKRYVVKVPCEISKLLDEKLAKEGKHYSDIAMQAILKYLKKS